LETKQSILDTALKLFNNKGAYSITTRHIASEMSISPGNLYYHYRNKEEIIRHLLEKMTEDFSRLYKDWPTEVEYQRDFNDLISETGNIIYEYRFFYAEIATLVDKDPILRKMYIEIKKDRINDFEKVYSVLCSLNCFVTPISDHDFNTLVENAWSMSEFIIQSMLINNVKITRLNINQYFKRIMHIIKPYLKKEIWDGAL